MTPDEDILHRRALGLLLPAGQVVELRAPDADTGRDFTATLFGYFDDPAKLLAEAGRIAAEGVYFTLNPVDPALLARCCNRVRKARKKDAATGDRNIVRRRWLLVDVDAERVSGVCATDAEKAEACAVADAVAVRLAAEGWTDPVVIDSGNGVYLLYAIDLPADDGGLVKRCLEALAAKFDTDRARIDTGVFNPSRIVRVPGTMNRKGDSLPGRPHRRVAVIACLEDPRPVRAELLEALAATVGDKTGTANPGVGNGTGEFRHRLDVPAYLTHFGIGILSTATGADGQTKWRVVCPFNPDHRGTDAYLFRYPSGAHGFHCSHNSCGGNRWQQFKDAVGRPLPDHYDPPMTAARPVAAFTDTSAPPTASAPAPTPPEWPAPPGPEAYHGLLGDIVRALEPETEADPVALLVQALTMFGNAVGRRAHFRVEGTRHFTNLFAALVGTTSGGRKGTSHGRVKPLFAPLDEDWLRRRNVGGLSSAEGLLYQVRDANERDEDAGEDDKRLMLTEPEFANVLKQTERQGNTVSVYLRQLWDGLDVVQTLTKNAPVKATDAHVSVIGHITPEELHRCLTATETANGFANRFLFACVRRSKFLPDGGTLNPRSLPPLCAALEAAAGFAQSAGEVVRHPSARPLWHAVYPTLTADRAGLAGAMTARAAPHTLRLALLYALLDRSPVILSRHLMAGLAVWDYCERSVNFLFGDRTGNPLADELRELLRNAPAGLTRSELNKAMGNHAHGDRLTTALNALRAAGLARCEAVQTGGRTAERWHATHRDAAESPLMKTARTAVAGCVGSVESAPVAPAQPFQRFARFPRTGADTPGMIFSAPQPPPPPTTAETWLVNLLRNGPRAKSDIDRAAKAAGVPRVNALGSALRVVIESGRAGAWSWRLPDGFDLGRYPIPPEPPAPALLDDLADEPPPTTEPTAKRRKAGRKSKAVPAKPSGNPILTADGVERLLRKAKRPWSDIAEHLESLGEYFDPALEVRGLTGRQLALVVAMLPDDDAAATPTNPPREPTTTPP